MNHHPVLAHLPEILADTRRLRRRFASTAPRSWDASTAAAELQVQMGHLALCLLRRDGGDTSDVEDPDRRITDLGDELADVILAAASVAVLTGVEAIFGAQPLAASSELEAFLRLSILAGGLSEVTLVDRGYRHQSQGSVGSIATSVGAVLAACCVLADQLGLDVLDEFRVMVTDAEAFLDDRGVVR